LTLHSQDDSLERIPDSGRHIFTVSELTAQIKVLLEDTFHFIWITGEISDFRIPASGHFYFTLKDETSRIPTVMFKGQNRHLTFQVEDGMRVVGLGRVSVYEPRGTYQVILELLEPQGVGALQIAFEQLKQRLFTEGLFDAKWKQPVPFLPEKIAILTSATGAVVHDIYTVARRRFENIRLLVIPTAVQGPGAGAQIVSAIELLNTAGKDGGPVADVAILARGGGSLEDLQAFNSEAVARAVFASRVPIVSAVGHETDFTIADFVADLRAPTPSAAAELVIPQKADLILRIRELRLALERRMFSALEEKRRLFKESAQRLKSPQKKIEDHRLLLDDLTQRLIRGARNRFRNQAEKLAWRTESLCAKSPLGQLQNHKLIIENYKSKILKTFKIYINNIRGSFQTVHARFQALSPMGVLGRGYSIARTVPAGEIIRNPDQVDVDSKIDLVVAEGAILCRVERKRKNGQTNL